MGTPFPRPPSVLESARAAMGEAPGRIAAAVAPANPWADPRDLVSRAFALLDEETQAWLRRRQAESPPGKQP